jgi:hypothetical protein
MTVAQARERPDAVLAGVVTVTLMMGLRPAETGALSWEDVGDGVLHARHSLHDSRSAARFRLLPP